jgi:hypothetical protein
VFTGFFQRRRGHLTKFCERWMTPRMIHKAASDDAAPFAQNLFARRVIATTIGDTAWTSFLANADHPKRSVVLCMVILMAAADFWKRASKQKEIYSAAKSRNPISSMHSDIIVIEGSFFFWYNFVTFIFHAVEKGELVKADKDAMIPAGALMCHIIQATTHSAINEIFAARVKDYRERESHEDPIVEFVRVLLRSVEKRTLADADRRLLPSLSSPGLR